MMAQSVRSMLMDALSGSYDSLRRRLTKNLGSRDLASEALHETWLDLNKESELGHVRHPDAYLYLSALYKARRLRKKETLLLIDAAQASTLLDIPDDQPGPERIAMGRSELARLGKTLDVLTRRQRVIFIETFLHDVDHDVLAERFGVSNRTIRNELREAMTKMTRPLLNRNHFHKPAPPPSPSQGGPVA